MIKYQCQDKDCQKVIPETRRLKMLFKLPSGKLHTCYKCPHCRGNIKAVEDDQ